MRKPEEITDDEIRDFVKWHKSHYQRKTDRVDLMAISAAGHFHMTQKTATPLIHRAITLGFLIPDGKDTVKYGVFRHIKTASTSDK